MAQYLSPGVYVEEVSFRSGTIEGVSTSTAAFVGPTRYGPTSGMPTVLTCLADYVAIYGSIDPLAYADAGQTINFVGQAVRAFFDNGGSLCYVSRTWNPGVGIASPPEVYGYAQATLASHASPPQTVTWKGRYPGSEGNVTLTITLSIGQNVLFNTASGPTLRSVNNYDIVWISPAAAQGVGGAFQCAESYLNKANGGTAWRFRNAHNQTCDISTMGHQEVRVFTASLQIAYPDGTTRTDFYPGLTFDPRSATSFAQIFAAQLSDSYYQLTRPIIFSFSDATLTAGIEIANLMLAQATSSSSHPVTIPNMIQGLVAQPQYIEQLLDGQDGYWPTSSFYQGQEDPSKPLNKTGLYALEDLSDVSIVAAPGSTYNAAPNATSPFSYYDAQETTNYLIAHCEKMLYRIAVLDSPNNQAIPDVSAWRGQFDSEYAA